MAAYSRRTSSHQHNGAVFRSLSPSGRFASSSSSLITSNTSTTSNSFIRSISPPRVIISPSSPSVRFSVNNRPISPTQRSISTINHHNHIKKTTTTTRRTCMCSPTTHPGSFRCSLHKGTAHSNSTPQPRLNAWRRSAMTNSLVRICGVEGDLVKRALAALIRPSSHQQRRRTAFSPKPSRLSLMSKAYAFAVDVRTVNNLIWT
ncbi:hypothetical protein ACFE04_002621 [Oxalis oulophora]